MTLLDPLTEPPASPEAVVGRSTARPCPACARSDADLVHTLALQAPDGHPLGDGYDVVVCRACGTGFADVAGTLDFYDTYYAESAKYAHEAELTAPTGRAQVSESEHTAARLDVVADRIAALLPSPEARILDIGCSTGTLLAALRRRGFQHVVGLDPAPESRVVARAMHDVSVEVGTLSTMPDDLGLFDCVSLIGVLEHLWDVDEALRIITGLLKPNGVLYLDLPDASRYLDPYIAPFQDFGIEHVNHFSPESLRTLARRTDFEAGDVIQWEPTLVPGQLCSSMAMAFRKSTPASPTPFHDELVEDPVIDDAALRQTLHAFAARSAADMAAIDRRLEEQLGTDEEFAVWGAGEFTMKLLGLPALRRRRLVAVVDANASRRGLRFGGVSVADPTTLAGSSAPVIAGSLLSGGSISRGISASGCRAVTCS